MVTAGSSFDTLLAVYVPGPPFGTLLRSNDDCPVSGSGVSSCITTTLPVGTTEIRVQVRERWVVLETKHAFARVCLCECVRMRVCVRLPVRACFQTGGGWVGGPVWCVGGPVWCVCVLLAWTARLLLRIDEPPFGALLCTRCGCAPFRWTALGTPVAMWRWR